MKDLKEYIGNGLMYILTIVQTKELFQIISLCLSILISLIIIIEKIIYWYKKAKEDGKINSDEIKELQENLSEDVKNLVDVVEEINKENKDD